MTRPRVDQSVSITEKVSMTTDAVHADSLQLNSNPNLNSQLITR